MKMIFELLPNCLGSPENKEAVFASCWKCRTANTIRNITEIRKPPLAYRHRRSYHLSNLFSSLSSFLFLTCSILLWMFFRVLQVFFFFHVMFVQYSVSHIIVSRMFICVTQLMMETTKKWSSSLSNCLEEAVNSLGNFRYFLIVLSSQRIAMQMRGRTSIGSKDCTEVYGDGDSAVMALYNGT